MNIERMQKINDLAQQLVEKGVYDNLTDATQQAESMINKGDAGISDVLGTEQEKQEAQPQKTEEEELKLQLRKLSYQVNEQSRTISELKSQLKSLLNDIEKMKSEPKSSPILERKSENDQTSLSKEATEKKSHARSGKYESDDVSIEKVFYSGPPKE